MDVTYVFEEEKNEPSKTNFHFSKEFFIQFAVSFVATLIIFIIGTHVGWQAPTILKLSLNTSEIHLTSSEISWLTASLPLGGGIGPIIGAICANRIGRKNTILLATIPEIITWILIVYAKNVYHLCVAQFIKGIVGNVAMAIVPMYVAEISSPQFRGINCMLIQLQYTLGTMFEVILVPFVSIGLNAWIASIIPIFLLLNFIWLPESPYYFLIKNKIDDARNSLRMLRQSDNIDKQLEHLRKVVLEEQSEVQKFSDIFRVRNNRVSFILCIGIISTQLLTGLTIIISYSQVILEKSNSPIEPHICGMIISIISLICSVISLFVIDSLGRKPIMLFATFGAIIPCFVIGVYFHLDSINYQHISSFRVLPFLALILYQITVFPGLSIMPFVYLGEMLSISIKGFATIIICCYVSIGYGILNMFYANVCDLIGLHNVFYLFVCGCFISGIGIYFFVPETKGKSLDEIQKILKNYHVK